MAKYHGFDKAAFGHVSINDETDIKLVTILGNTAIWYEWRNPSYARKETRGGKIRRNVTLRFLREINVAVEKTISIT